MLYVIGLVWTSINLGMEIQSSDHSIGAIFWLVFVDAIAFICVLFHALRLRDGIGESIWM